MRVISGIAKGRKLVAPEGEDVTRPTGDRVKEAIFGAIQFGLAGARVLDLFAGSGALGIEALSRGAALAVFIDSSKSAIDALRQNLQNTGLADKARVLQGDYKSSLKGIKEKFDYVFLDPPYQAGFYEEAISLVREGGLLSAEGVIIAEHSADMPLKDEKIYKTKKYGATCVSYLER